MLRLVIKKPMVQNKHLSNNIMQVQYWKDQEEEKFEK